MMRICKTFTLCVNCRGNFHLMRSRGFILWGAWFCNLLKNMNVSFQLMRKPTMLCLTDGHRIVLQISGWRRPSKSGPYTIDHVIRGRGVTWSIAYWRVQCVGESGEAELRVRPAMLLRY